MEKVNERPEALDRDYKHSDGAIMEDAKVLTIYKDYPKAKAWDEIIEFLEEKGIKFTFEKSRIEAVKEILVKGL